MNFWLAMVWGAILGAVLVVVVLSIISYRQSNKAPEDKGPQRYYDGYACKQLHTTHEASMVCTECGERLRACVFKGRRDSAYGYIWYEDQEFVRWLEAN